MSPSSTETITYPPTAHISPDGAEETVISSQPKPAMGMTPQGGQNEETEKAERLRGGCIPCPGGICWIIPIPCCCC
ncbi:unnamed protein product [Somion occarium]|uniref:Cysteine-rich transmembrane CYSTM domain-containing protein n=1 Tax=Somion occarium TaxID=3059160 RepID=A0ABP1DNQ3_9APHY